MVWHGVWHGTARHGTTGRDVTLRYGAVRYGMIWYGVYNMPHTVYGYMWHMWYGIITIIIWLCY